jgi:hypothetical protein
MNSIEPVLLNPLSSLRRSRTRFEFQIWDGPSESGQWSPGANQNIRETER